MTTPASKRAITMIAFAAVLFVFAITSSAQAGDYDDCSAAYLECVKNCYGNMMDCLANALGPGFGGCLNGCVSLYKDGSPGSPRACFVESQNAREQCLQGSPGNISCWIVFIRDSHKCTLQQIRGESEQSVYTSMLGGCIERCAYKVNGLIEACDARNTACMKDCWGEYEKCVRNKKKGKKIGSTDISETPTVPIGGPSTNTPVLQGEPPVRPVDCEAEGKYWSIFDCRKNCWLGDINCYFEKETFCWVCFKPPPPPPANNTIDVSESVSQEQAEPVLESVDSYNDNVGMGEVPKLNRDLLDDELVRFHFNYADGKTCVGVLKFDGNGYIERGALLGVVGPEDEKAVKEKLLSVIDASGNELKLKYALYFSQPSPAVTMMKHIEDQAAFTKATIDGTTFPTKISVFFAKLWAGISSLVELTKEAACSTFTFTNCGIDGGDDGNHGLLAINDGSSHDTVVVSPSVEGAVGVNDTCREITGGRDYYIQVDDAAVKSMPTTLTTTAAHLPAGTRVSCGMMDLSDVHGGYVYITWTDEDGRLHCGYVAPEELGTSLITDTVGTSDANVTADACATCAKG